MKDNSLSQWLYKNNCFLKQGDDRKYTHLCLDGGRLFIYQSIHNEFIERYAEGLVKDERYYICEVPTNISRMYCDLDFIEESEISLDKIKEVTKVIYDIIRIYYDDDFEIIVCTTDSKDVTRNKMKLVKTGVHLIWKNLFVKRKNALNLSKLFVNALIEKFGEREEYNKWDDVVDEAVYSENNSSLRMVGSAKIVKKKKINKDTKESELKKVDEGRIYLPVWICGVEENDNLFENMYEIVKMCTLRVFEAETDWIDDIPEYIEDETKKKKHEPGVSVISNDPSFLKLEEFIRSSTIPEWDRPLKYLKKQGKFYVAKIDGAMYCMNIEREHNSCGIYFQITEDGLTQRCFCRCKTLENRVDGFCKDYKSKFFKLPFELKILLFDLKKKKRKNSNSNSGKISSKGGSVIFGSYTNLKQDPDRYLKMSMSTVLHLEEMIKNYENNNV